MSMLYKSLQKLQKEEQGKGARQGLPPWYAHKSDNYRLLRVGGVALVLIGVSVALWQVLETRLEVYKDVAQVSADGPRRDQALRPVEALDRYRGAVGLDQRAADQPSAPQLQAESHAPRAPDRPTPVPEPARPMTPENGPPIHTIPDIANSLTPPSATVPVAPESMEPAPAAETSLWPSGPETGQVHGALEDHFSRQAERNREVMTISRTLREAYLRQDEKVLAASLDRLRDLLPPHSPLVKKWTGVLALTEGDLETARTLFEQLLQANPSDHDSRANLALILFRQGHKTHAQRHLQTLQTTIPDHPLVRELARSVQSSP